MGFLVRPDAPGLNPACALRCRPVRVLSLIPNPWPIRLGRHTPSVSGHVCPTSPARLRDGLVLSASAGMLKRPIPATLHGSGPLA